MNQIKLKLFRSYVKLVNDKKADAAPKVNGVITHSDIPYVNDELQWHKLDVYVPENLTQELPVILYIHGGGWSLSDKKHFRHFCQVIAADGYAVFNVNYRLAPEYRHPAQLLDVLSAVEWVRSHACEYGADPTKLFMFGDSAGAHLASLAVCVCTNSELENFYNVNTHFVYKNLCGCVLFCGTYDVEAGIKSSFPMMDEFVHALLGVKDINLCNDLDKLSVTKNINSKFPPCLVSDSSADALFKESEDLILALEKNGVKHKDLLFDDIGDAPAHEYQIEYDKPIFSVCIREIRAFLNECRSQDENSHLTQKTKN